MHLLVDSTGLKLCGAGEWLIEKHGTKRRRAWRVLHLATDADTGRIVASVLTDKDADDGSQVGPLLDRIDGSVLQHQPQQRHPGAHGGHGRGCYAEIMDELLPRPAGRNAEGKRCQEDHACPAVRCARHPNAGEARSPGDGRGCCRAALETR